MHWRIFAFNAECIDGCRCSFSRLGVATFPLVPLLDNHLVMIGLSNAPDPLSGPVHVPANFGFDPYHSRRKLGGQTSQSSYVATYVTLYGRKTGRVQKGPLLLYPGQVWPSDLTVRGL